MHVQGSFDIGHSAQNFWTGSKKRTGIERNFKPQITRNEFYWGNENLNLPMGIHYWTSCVVLGCVWMRETSLGDLVWGRMNSDRQPFEESRKQQGDRVKEKLPPNVAVFPGGNRACLWQCIWKTREKKRRSAKYHIENARFWKWSVPKEVLWVWGSKVPKQCGQAMGFLEASLSFRSKSWEKELDICSGICLLNYFRF